jgi:hypothetical protein
VTESKRPVLNVRLVIIVYGALVLVAIGWGWLQGAPNVFVLQASPWWRFEGPPWLASAAAVGGGIAVGLLVVGLSRLGTRYLEGFRRMERAFAEMLGELTPLQIFAAAAASAIGEEALFRGAMLPSLGIWLSSGIFGVLHMAPDRRFRAWPVLAFLMGLAFGGLALSFGNLIAPIIAHFLINFLNLRSIAAKARAWRGRAQREAIPGAEWRTESPAESDSPPDEPLH